MTEDLVTQVIDAGRRAAARGWVPATAGNFSVRLGAQVAITRSGRDKGRLQRDDVALTTLNGSLPPGLSAETPLHLARYQAEAGIGAVFHVHTPAATLASRRWLANGELVFEGWELQKAFAGVKTHATALHVPIVDNSQDIAALARQVEARLRRRVAKGQGVEGAAAPGYLIAGHGLYAWGATAEEAWRHLEAFDALLQLQLEWQAHRSPA